MEQGYVYLEVAEHDLAVKGETENSFSLGEKARMREC
jgi:hypothetical protein